MLTLAMIGLALAGDGWMNEDAELIRWPEADVEKQVLVAEVKSGAKIEVLVVDEDAGMTRVRNGDDFGWVVSDKVSDEDPAKKDGAGAKDEGAPPADP